MLTYEEFKSRFIGEFMDYMGPEFKGHELSVRKVFKVNQELDALNVINPNAGEQITPTVYIDEAYGCYTASENFEEVILNFSKIIKKYWKGSDYVNMIDFNKAKDKVVFQVINTYNNQSLLADVPHREIMDLSVIYRWAISVDNKGVSSVVIHNELMKSLGVDEEELFNLAYENTRRIFKPEVSGMEDIIKNISSKCGKHDDDLNKIIDEMGYYNGFFVIGNSCGFMGASAILYEDILFELAKRCKSDLYILPSSINELIAISSNCDISAETLLDMVISINEREIDPVDLLSNSVYFYSASDHSIVPVAIQCVN